MFRKILIANRGEIAVRVIRACREMGISPVAVYSEADRDALHVQLADEAYQIGPAPSSQSYLAIERILDAAQRCGAQAIHPGYGFLAENEAFAQACQDARIDFIGPSPSSIRLMGDKIASRKAMIEAGVPVLPGTEGSVETVQEAIQAARTIGYPVILKASAGGGGKGMRVVGDESQLASAFSQARSEAEAAFSNPTVFLEKFLRRPRHIEVQVLGDRHGNLIHLGERECSIQRRHQKVVEESPSPIVDEEFRQELGETALKAARAVDYYNAGTVEMLLEESGQGPRFYFLEMNTRLQVEHPLTELVTGVDLVRQQIRLASGQELRYRQQDIRLRGAAIECRIYAEDPFQDFFPSPGKILTLFEPAGPGIRNDSGVYSGFTIPIHYDPLISKLVAYGDDRRQAIQRMRRALKEYRIAGVRTNQPFFEVLLTHPEFLAGRLSTDFIERHGLLEQMRKQSEDGTVPLLAASIAYFLESRSPAGRPATTQSDSRAWKYFDRFPTAFKT